MTMPARLDWRRLDRAELDRQYDARATVADIRPILERYRADTDAAKATVPCALAIPYGPSEPERLDVYRATAGEGPRPVFVFVHGGYWRLLDAADSGFMAPAMAAAGIVTVALNYALLPGVTLAEAVRQCRAAIAWIHGHIADFGGDPGAIHVCGSSAGGHLCAMLAADDWAADFGLPRDVIKSAAPISGLFDLSPLPHCHVDAWTKLTPDDVAALSPALHLPRPDLPVTLAHAETDTDGFKGQSEDYADRLIAAGNPVGRVDVPGSNHFAIVFDLADPASRLFRAITAPIGAMAPHPGGPVATPISDPSS